MDYRKMNGIKYIVCNLCLFRLCIVYNLIFSLFMGTTSDVAWPLNISSIILQSTSSNLESLIGPLTILDNILSENVNIDNIIFDNSKAVSVLSYLFSSILSGKEYVGNKYIWNTFNTFIMSKKDIFVRIAKLDKYCLNKNLLALIFSDLIKNDDDDNRAMIINKNQNLVKPEILKIFKNVTYLRIHCKKYPLSLESLLSLINGTQIKTVVIDDPGSTWLSSVKSSSFADVSSKYKKANFKMEFEGEYKLVISCSL